MFTIGQISLHAGISRSTLIHYDRTGILKPTGRDSSNYRVYTEDDLEKLKQINRYRSLGICLDDISALINNDASSDRILNKRLKQIEQELSQLREQRIMLTRLMKHPDAQESGKTESTKKWKSLFMKLGFSDKNVRRWHILFENQSPDDHQCFLESLGFPEHDIVNIRKTSRIVKSCKVTTHNPHAGSSVSPTLKRK